MSTSSHVNVSQSALWECEFPITDSSASDGLDILGHQWKAVASGKEGGLNVQLQYLGPKEGCKIKYFDAEIVGGGSGFRKRSKKDLPFERGAKSFEVSGVAKLKDVDKHVKSGKLPLKITVTVAVPSGANETISMLHDVATMTAPGYKVPKSSSRRSSARLSGSRASLGDLKLKVEQLTVERNSLHKSLHDMQIDESTAALLSSNFPAQPEAMEQYDAFTGKLAPLLLDLFMEYGDDSTSKVASTLKSSAMSIKNYIYLTWHKNKISKFKSLTGLGESKIATIEGLLTNMIRTTFDWKKKLTKDDEAAAVEALGYFPEKLQEKFDFFPRFVYSMTMYLQVASNVNLRWDTIGMESEFNSDKHRQLDDKIAKGAKVVVLLPALTVSKGKGSTVLCKALVVEK